MGIGRLFRPNVFLAAILAVAILAGGCAGPSTRILPRETKGQHEPPEEVVVLEEGNPFYLQEELDILTSSPRSTGSEGEQEAVEYIRQLFDNYGYEVKLQHFPVEDGNGQEIYGTNVVAVRAVSSGQADILVVGAHHDTLPGSPGANESASGVAALLEISRLLSRIPTDTELHFVSFSGHQSGQAGIRYYVHSLPENDRQRVIGAIQLDALGYVREEGMVRMTADGRPTMLGDILESACQDVLKEEWPYELRQQETACIYALGQIPAVYISQKREAYEQGSRFDTPQIVNIERVCQIVNVVSRGVSEIISLSTPSMLAKSRYYNDLRDGAFVQRSDVPVPFGEEMSQTEGRLGTKGVLVAENTDQEGRLFRAYRYMVKWFGVDQILLTDYYYTEDKLIAVSIDGDGAGVELEEMEERLVSVYGQPQEETETPYGKGYGWNIARHRTSLLLSPENDGYSLELWEFPAKADQLAMYEVFSSDGSRQLQLRAGGQEGSDVRLERLVSCIGQLLPMKVQDKVEAVKIYTDGIGASRTYLETFVPETEDAKGEDINVEDRRRYVWAVDLEDALTEEGKWRNETDTVRQILLLYGEMLGELDHGRYRAAFDNAFPESGQGDTAADLSAPEGADLVHQPQLGVKPGDYIEPPPDFAASFLWFVLTDRPEEADGEWGVRIGFFYQFDELAAYRMQIRNNLKLEN